MTTEAEQHLRRIVEQNNDKFSNFDTQKNLTEKYNLDTGRAAEYKGRELFELLQNVDDAYEELCKKEPSKRGAIVKASVEYIGNILRVSNYGTAFSENTINSLCQGGVSEKGKEYIGNKGIGFRSLLNWASEIHIWSGDYSIRFSEEFAAQQFHIIYEKSETVREEKRKLPELKYPILSAPEPYNVEKPNDYTTIIEVVIKEDTQNNVWNLDKQIKEFNPEILLFLPNVTNIDFNQNGEKFSFNKTKGKENSQIIIQKLNDNKEILYSKTYYLYKKNELINSIPLKMGIAIPENYDSEILEKNKFFTFFPIRDAFCPFPALLHSTFKLNRSRDTIDRDDINVDVMKHLLDFYISTVVKNFVHVKFENYAIQLLTPYTEKFLPTPFDKMEIQITEENTISFFDYYIQQCKTKKLLLNVNKRFLIPSPNIRILSDYPNTFNGLSFNSLLSNLPSKCIKFVKQLTNSNNEYTDKELELLINQNSENWAPEDRIETFFWWINNYPNSNCFPHLLRIKSKSIKWVSKEKNCFFSSGKFDDIPEWASIDLLDDDDKNRLLTIFTEQYQDKLDSKKHNDDKDKNPVRLTIRYLSEDLNLPFLEYVTRSLVSPINESINENYQHSIDFVNWLYQYFDDLKTGITTLKEIDYQFPGADGKVHSSKQLYLGKNYNNKYSKILDLTSYTELASLSSFNFSDINKAIEFFLFFNVLEVPPVYSDDITYRKDEYYKYLRTEITKRYYEKNVRLSDLELFQINNYEHIIQTLSANEIISWILDDKNPELFQKLSGLAEGKIKFYYGMEWTPRTFSYQITPYLRYILSSEKWLLISGKKVSPNQCLFREEDKISRFIPCITHDYLIEISGSHNLEDVQNLLRVLGVKDNIVTLSSQNYYSLLLNLQETANTKEISTQIYRQSVIYYKDYKNLEIFGPSEAKSIFFTKGKVWSKTLNKYTPIQDTFFYGSATINISKKSLIALPLRTGSREIVEKIFGVKEFSETYSLFQYDVDEHLSQEFSDYFDNYKPYIFCYRMDDAKTAEIEKFQQLTITLVNKAILKNAEGEEKTVLQKYQLLSDENNDNHYLITINNDTKLTIDNFVSNIEQILSIIINTQNKDQLFKYTQIFLANNENRNRILQSDFENVDYTLERSRNILNGMLGDKKQLTDFLKSKGLLNEKSTVLLNQISFTSFESKINQEHLFELLNEIKIDLPIICNVLKRNDLTIKKVLSEKAIYCFSKYSDYYYYTLRDSLLSKSLTEQMQFLNRGQDYDNYEIPLRDSIFYNPMEELKKYFEANSLIFVPEVNLSEYNYRVFYSANLNKLESENYNTTDIDRFANSSNENYSLFFFDYEQLKNQLNEYIKKYAASSKKDNPESSDKKKGELRGKKPPINSGKNGGKGKRKRKEYVSPELKEKEDELKLKQADKAEETVFNEIGNRNIQEINEYFQNSDNLQVNWCSAAAKRKKNFFASDTSGYDIEVKDLDTGNHLYIEVKSSSQCILSFEMSKNEYDCAITNPGKYMVIFVANVDIEKEISISDIHPLPLDFLTSDDFYVQASNYNVFLLNKSQE